MTKRIHIRQCETRKKTTFNWQQMFERRHFGVWRHAWEWKKVFKIVNVAVYASTLHHHSAFQIFNIQVVHDGFMHLWPKIQFPYVISWVPLGLCHRTVLGLWRQNDPRIDEDSLAISFVHAQYLRLVHSMTHTIRFGDEIQFDLWSELTVLPVSPVRFRFKANRRKTPPVSRFDW